SRNKMAYMYVLTPKGISVRLTQTYTFLQRKLNDFELTQTYTFLQRKLNEFEMLKHEIEVLRKENGEFKNLNEGDRQF
ncbi:MAG: hypothetical protein H6R43_353, partial [Nitrospirae bacterium]|nr:hypothetical protein [Nitrospirota bacterium]